MEPQETAKRETEPEEEARRLRFNELWLQVIERSEQHLNEKIDELMQTAIETTETITVCEE